MKVCDPADFYCLVLIIKLMIYFMLLYKMVDGYDDLPYGILIEY